LFECLPIEAHEVRGFAACLASPFMVPPLSAGRPYPPPTN
jgi:hypothetical protein